ncbi:ABC transporter permease subunit [Aquamicrobium sp. NLF2-7]|uniref:ABC transporter permease subunit n=1 Tax=Aquamicrobium sp. NLF2-7 TaxID=2918753 RepID=UPI001EFBF9C9|nr:ABC transporter permease subunit [Aquamicrobium sp. NLF2-7]MCG8274315.1 ABC transporter permease subunit [Aquamicrobium sp. NLF2-7]
MLILLYATFWVSLNTMIMKNFFDQIPYELDEAAYVDGARSGSSSRRSWPG